MTLRIVHRVGYRVSDLAWLRMRELELLCIPDDDLRDASSSVAAANDAAFTI